MLHQKRAYKRDLWSPGGGDGVGYFQKNWAGCAPRFLKPLPYFRPKSVFFPTLFQTWLKIRYPNSYGIFNKMGDIPKKKAFEVPNCYEIKSYEKILGERQNTCKSREKRKTTFCSKSGKKTEARRLNLIKVVHLRWLPRVNWRCAAWALVWRQL